MKDLLIIFKGWSSTDGLYEAVRKIYSQCDVIFSSELDRVDRNSYRRLYILAWSMGTLDAIEYAEENETDEMLLLSPTLNFTATTRPVIVKRMIRKLDTDLEGCLRDFTLLCFKNKRAGLSYWKEYRDEVMSIPVEVLREGLEKLLNKKLEYTESSKSPLIILGDEDEIISTENSEEVVKIYPRGERVVIEGGHNLLYEKNNEVADAIRKYRRKLCHT